MNRSRIIAVAALLIVSWCAADAQLNASSLLSATSDRVTSTNYYYARPNDLTIIVNVVGFVVRPGRYEVASSIDLVDLLSLAGGPTPDGTLSDIKITRTTTEGGTVTRTETEISLSDLTKVKTEQLQLKPGDIVEVDRATWASFRDVFNVFVSAAIITAAVAQVIIATKR